MTKINNCKTKNQLNIFILIKKKKKGALSFDRKPVDNFGDHIRNHDILLLNI